MPRYQFFTFPHNQTTDFTYLKVETEDYINDKNALLEQQIEIDGEPIVADSAPEAVKKYNSDLSRASQEQVKGHLSYFFVEGLISMWKWIRQRKL